MGLTVQIIMINVWTMLHVIRLHTSAFVKLATQLQQGIYVLLVSSAHVKTLMFHCLKDIPEIALP